MNKPKWTPGPWTAGRPDMGTVVDGITSKWIYAGDQYCAVASGRIDGEWDEVMANAHLIAAAPDLYEALREISDALEGAKAANPEASIEFFDELVEIEPGWRKRLKDALAKARGETA